MQRDPAAGGNVPAHGGEALVAFAPGLAAIAPYRIENWAKLPACHLGPDKLWALRERVGEIARSGEVSGIVVTHGTDILEETAYLLARTLPATVPVAITGAMLTSSDEGWDGPRNLLDAASVAATGASAGRGAMVVFHGRIFAGETAVKTHATDVAAFSAPHGRPLGRVLEGRVSYDALPGDRPPPVHPRGSMRAWRSISLVVGDDGTHARPGARPEHDGVVVVAFGSGNMPPGAVPAVRRWLDEGKPVVLAIRCHSGEVSSGLRFRGRRGPDRRHGRDSGGPAHAVAGADGAGARALGGRRATGGDERSRRPGDSGRGAGDRPHARGGRARGLVRGRRAARRAARPSRTRTTTSPRPPRPDAGHRALPPDGAGGREVRHGRRARPLAGAARGDHLPARRRAPTGATRWWRTVCRSRRIWPGGTSRSTPSRTIRCGGEWRDPFGGREDLARRLIRAVGEPAERFREDYLRILRGIRFAARLGFAVEPATWAAAVAAAPGLAQLSAERVRDEWFKGLRTARSPAELVELWTRVGASERWMPELAAVPAERLDRIRDVPVRRSATRSCSPWCFSTTPSAVLRRLRASNAEIERAAAVARGPGAPAGADAGAVRRWLAAVGRAADDLLALQALRTGTEAPWAGSGGRDPGAPRAADPRRPGGDRRRSPGARCLRAPHRRAARGAARPGARRAEPQRSRDPSRPRPGAAVIPIGFALAAALGNVVGALAVVRHERRESPVHRGVPRRSAPGSCSRSRSWACCPRCCATRPARRSTCCSGISPFTWPSTS